MRLVLLGPPGAGKGTQAAIIAEAHDIPHVATGDIFRANVQQETALGTEAKAYMDRGELVPDDVVIGMVQDRLTEDDAAEGFLLDGFPRTVPQAEAFEVWLQERDWPLDAVIRFVAPEEELIARLESRREIEGRSDDDSEVIRKRLVEYRSKTEPLEQFYAERGLLRDVEAVGEIEEVGRRTLDLLASLERA
ncbi:MAG: adenylate kinase [Actinomycetota bacterium]